MPSLPVQSRVSVLCICFDKDFALVSSGPGPHKLLQDVQLGLFVNVGDEVCIDFPVDSTIDPAPEPSSVVLVGSYVLGLAGVLRRRLGTQTFHSSDNSGPRSSIP